MVLLLIGLCVGGCSQRKQSTINGQLVDRKGNPAAGIRITATPVKPIEGYGNLAVITKADGTFQIDGMLPSSQYVLRPVSDKWTCKTEVKVTTAANGEVKTLSRTVISSALSNKWGVPILDLATGRTQFSDSPDGVITDSRTGLQWLMAPDRDTNYHQATKWVAACKVAGGGWRLPTRNELLTVFQDGKQKKKLVPIFKTHGVLFWASPSWMNAFYVGGPGIWVAPGYSRGARVFVVRKTRN